MPDLNSIPPFLIGIAAILVGYWLVRFLIRVAKKMAIRAAVAVLLLIAYPAVRGPLVWLTEQGYLPRPVTRFLDQVYIPLDRVKDFAAAIHDTLGEYEHFWRR
ncbi:MAG: hypothetical protein JSS02_32435 [Planctomycetes bacterium]|nr:hypothetical protein [Planctomycetota bacterium]